MQTDSGRIGFQIDIDDTQLKQGIQRAKNAFSDLGEQVRSECAGMDGAFAGVAEKAKTPFRILEESVREASKSIAGMEFGTAEEKIGALSYAIEQNEQVIAASREMLKKWERDSINAFNAGDLGTMSAINADIEEQVAKIQQLTAETQDYRQTLEMVKSASGAYGGSGGAPMLFSGEKEIKHLEQLAAKIRETQAEISRMGADGGDTTALTAQLSAMRDELNGAQVSAASAAAALGGDLGARAAEAQASLHHMNEAVREQQQVVDEIKAKVEAAAAAYNEAKTSTTATAEEVERAAAKYDTLSASLAAATSQLSAMQGAQRDAQSNWRAVSDEIGQHDSIITKMLGGYDNYKSVLANLPAPLQAAISGVQGMTGAAKAFIATPLGACLAAIVLALQTIKTWMNSSVEGQMALARVSGYLSGILGQLKEIVIATGRAIFKAFSDPKQAVTELWDTIKENLVNRMKAIGGYAGAMGRTIKAAFTFDTEGVKQGLKEMGEQFLQFTTGVENLTGKVKGYINGVHDAAAENSTISEETRKLEVEVAEWGKRNQELEAIKAKARGRMMNRSLSTDEMRKEKKVFEDAVREQYETEKKFAEKRVELQQRSMELTTNTIEDENKLRELQAASLAADTRMQQQLALMQRREGYMANQDETAAQRAAKLKAQREQALTELGEMEARMITDNERRKLEAMQEGKEKQLAGIEQNRADQLRKAEELQNDLARKNKAAGKTDTGEDGLTDNQRETIAQSRALIEAAYRKQVGDIMEGEITDILTYEEKRLKITEHYARQRAIIEAGGMQHKLPELERQEKSQLMKLDFEQLKISPDYAAAFADLGGTATDTLQALAQRLGELKTAAAEGMNPEDVRQYADALQRISDELTGRDPIKALAESYRELQAAAKELKAAQAALQSAKDGAAGADEEAKATERVAAAKKKHEEASRKFGKSEKQVQQQVGALCDEMKNLGDTIGGEAGKIVSLIGDIGNFVLTTGESMKAVSGMASESISTLEKATIVLQAITAAYQIAMKIAELFVGDDGMKAYENAQKLYKSYADTLREVAEAELTLMEATAGRDSEAAYRRATDLMAKQAEAARELGRQYLNAGANAGKHSNGLRQWRGISAKAWEQAAAAARKYGIDTERAFGGRMTGLFDLTAEQLKGLQHDAALFWASLAEDTREYMEAVVNAAEQADEAAKRRAAHYTATDFDSLREEFKSAVSDMETSAADFADTFRNLIRNAIIEALMAKTYDSQIQALMDRFAAAMEDGSMGADELSALTAEKERIYRDLRAEVEAVNQFLGTSRKAQSGGTAGGFAAASQESVEELNGRFTAMQMDSAEIRALMAATAGEISRLATTAGQTWATADEIRGISLQCLDHLERIQRNTAELYEINTRLGRIERNTQ